MLAYQADLMRIIGFMMGHETSDRAYPECVVPDARHALSHHGGDKVLTESWKPQLQCRCHADIRVAVRACRGDAT